MKFPRCLQLIVTVSLLVCVSVESLTMEEAKNNPDCNCTNGKCVCSKIHSRTSNAHRRFYSTVYPGNLDETNGLGNFEGGNDDPSTKAITTELTTPEPTKLPPTTTVQPNPPNPKPTEPPPQPDATAQERWQPPQPPPNTFPNVFVTSWSDNGKTQTFGMSFNGGELGNQKMPRTDGNYPPSPTNIQVKTENHGNGFNSGFSGSWTASGTGGQPSGTNFFGTGVLPSDRNAFATAFNNGGTSETSNMPGNGQNFGFDNGQNFGMNNGQNFGFNNGQKFGFNNLQNFGFDNGQNFGFNNGQNFGFNNLQNFGFDNGQNFGFNNGQNFGFNNGQKFGFDNGQNFGFNNGKNFGFDNGQNLGFNNEQDFGFDNGFSGAKAFASSGNQDGGNGSLMPKLFPNFDFGDVQPFDINFDANGFDMPTLQ